MRLASSAIRRGSLAVLENGRYDQSGLITRSEDRLIEQQNSPIELVARITAGDRRAEEELILRFAKGVKIVLQYNTQTPDVAEDMFQDTFITVLNKIRDGQIREPDKLKQFIHSVARNVTTQHYRKNTRRKTDSDLAIIDRMAAETTSPFDLVEHGQVLMLLEQAIGELPVKRDQVLLRRYFFEDATTTDLCNELGVDRVHFYRLKHRAIKRLTALVRGRLNC